MISEELEEGIVVVRKSHLHFGVQFPKHSLFDIAERQSEEILESVAALLESHDAAWADIISFLVLTKDRNDFEKFKMILNRWMVSNYEPVLVGVEVKDLPKGVKVGVSGIVFLMRHSPFSRPVSA